MRTSAGVTRWGSTAGTLVPMRMISTWGIILSRESTRSSWSSASSSGSPPDRSTSRMAGRAAM